MNYSSTSIYVPKPKPDRDFSSTTKVILVRHGRTNYNEQGRYQGSSDRSVLTEKGYKAAYKTGLALQQFNFDGIYTSPLKRVRQTTQAILTALRENNNYLPSVSIAPQLTEINMSHWQGLLYREVKAKYPEAYNCWQETPHLFSFDNYQEKADNPEENQQSFPVINLFQQAQKFWQQILAKHRGKTILIVAHGGTNRALISTAIGLEPKFYHSLQQSNCGISCLEFPLSTNNKGQLKSLNTTDHLEEYTPKLKAGKTGWRWLLLPNTVTEDIRFNSCLSEISDRKLLDLILTDNTPDSEKLADRVFKTNSNALHLSIDKNHFIANWQQAIANRKNANSSVETPNLTTGLIIASEKTLDKILTITLGTSVTSTLKNNLCVIHSPHCQQQSILQGILPLEKQLIAR